MKWSFLFIPLSIFIFSCNNSKKTEEKKSEFFKSLDILSIGKKIFNSDLVDKHGLIIWSPGKDSTMRFLTSFDSLCHTKPDTIYQYDSAGSPKAIALFTTYMVDDSSETISAGFANAVPTSYVILNNTNEGWKIQSFNRGFESGEYGEPDSISFLKVGKDKYALKLKGKSVHQGDNEQTYTLFDISNGKEIFTRTEQVASPEGNVNIEMDLKTDSSKTASNYWPVLIILKGKNETGRVNAIEKYIYNVTQGEYVFQK